MEFGKDVLEIDPEEIFSRIERFGVYENCEPAARHTFPELTGSYKLRLVLPQKLLDHDRLKVHHIEVLQGDGSVPKKRLPYTDFLEWPGWSRKRTRRSRGVIVPGWKSNS